MRLEDLVIVSVDDHAIEPPEAFIRHYPESKKGRAPRIVSEGGKDVWVRNGFLGEPVRADPGQRPSESTTRPPSPSPAQVA